MQKWLNYFEQNRTARSRIPWECGLEMEAGLREPLVRSLQKFQLGESGEGRRLRAHAHATGDAAYSAAIELFVQEEQEHARLMAGILNRLGVPLLHSHWSEHCFVWLRRQFGLHQELMVLLLPEMIAKRYFRALRDGTRNKVLRSIFNQIVHDEDGHVAFHVEHLRTAFSSMTFSKRVTVLILWRILFRGACLAMLFDHWSVLRAVGVSTAEFWRDCGAVFDETAAGIFSPVHVLAPVQLNMGESR